MKRILATLMLLVFVVTSFAVMPASAAAFNDVKAGSKTDEAVTVLNKLGIINGYTDGTFKPTNNVTRAEFTAMLLRTRGMAKLGSTSLENPPFPDVTDPSVSWAIGNIRTARDMKIINGYEDGTFRPNNTVTYEEAIKMIVCALGYGDMGVAAEGTAWYAKYLAAATQLKFLDGAGGQIGVPATRETIAIMLYNCLEVKIAENNEITEKTILEADLGLIKNEGFIASNPEISLSTPDANLRDDEVQITAPNDRGHLETLTYKVDNMEEYADLLGAQITFYYSEDRGLDSRTLVMANVKKSVTVEVEADNIEVDECSESVVAFYESESASRLTKLNIASDSIVVYNGQLYGVDAEASTYEIYCSEMGDAAIPLVGSMKFLDRDGDKKYDIVFVDSYEAYIVSSVTSSTKTIVDNNLRKGIENKIVLDPDDLSKTVKIVDADGKSVAFSSIKKGSVVCVKASNELNGGEQIITAVVCNNTVSGSVKGVNSDDSIKIDSKTYNYSALAPWVNPIAGAEVVMSEPAMGDSGKFYLDLNGNIIGYDKTEVTSNQQYGYLMSARTKSEALETICVFNFMTQSGSKTSYYAYDKTKINGKTYSDYDKLLAALEDTANPSGASEYPAETENNDYSQMVKFSTKSYKGQVVVDEIITVTEDTMGSGADVETDKLNFFCPDGEITVDDMYVYDSTSKTLTGDEGKIYISSAIIIRVPNDRSDIDSYKKITTSSIGDEDELKVEFYDVSASNSAKIVLVYSGASNAGEVDAASPVMFITEIANEEDPSGENATRYHLTGYVGSSEVDYWGSTESEDVLKTLKEGDVVRLGTDDDGYYTVKEEHIIFRAEDGYRDKVYGKGYPQSEKIGSTVRYNVLWGRAVEHVEEDGRFVLAVGKELPETIEELDESETESVYDSWFSSAKVILVELDDDGDIADIITDSDTSELEAMSFLDSGVGDDVFVHMTSKSKASMVVIVKR